MQLAHVERPEELYDALELPRRGASGPHLSVNMVVTLDGKVTIARDDSSDVGSDFDHALMRHIRAHADAVVHGAGTVRPHPRHVGRAPALQPLRRQHQVRDEFLWVILSNSGDLPELEPVAPELRPLVIVSQAASAAAREQLSTWADVRVYPDGEWVDLGWMLKVLRDEYGCDRILCEGGPGVNDQLFAQGLVDQLFLTLAPKLSGRPDAKSLVEGDAVLPSEAFTLHSCFAHGDELFLRYGTQPSGSS